MQCQKEKKSLHFWSHCEFDSTTRSKKYLFNRIILSGINLRTGVQGIFPSAHIVDVEYSDFDPSQPKVRRERFILGYLGSVETLAHKGNSVLCQAVKKIRNKDYTPHSCILEISDTGIRMVDRKKPAVRPKLTCSVGYQF